MNLRKIASWLLIFSITLAVGCSKDESSEPSDSGKFKTTDFEISNISAEQEGPGYQVFVSYDVKNISGRDYDASKDGYLDVQWSIKATDGTLYSYLGGLPHELLKDAVSPETVTISVSAEKTADLSTLKYEVLLDEE